MEVTVLVKFVLGLIIVLSGLIFLFFYSSSDKKTKKTTVKTSAYKNKKQETDTDLESLRRTIKNKKTTSKELKETLNLVLKYHGRVHKKLGARKHPNFDIYADILFAICRHPKTNKDIIVNFERDLKKLNNEYSSDIDNVITKGLNSRGF